MAGSVDLSEEALEKILKETCTGIRRPAYTTLKGVFFPTCFLPIVDDLENFEVKDDDTWVCTFPKCGTTWMQEMVWCISHDLDFEGAKVPLVQRFPFIEFAGLFNYEPITDVKLRERFTNSIQDAHNMPSPRFIKTHVPYQFLPKQIRNGEKKPRMIYVARNPKDACISYYHHSKLLESYEGNLEQFCRLFLGNKITYSPYWDHVIEYWKRKDNHNNLFITFEEMKADLNSVIRRVARFLGKTNMTDEQVKTLEHHLSFESMKKNSAVNFSFEIGVFRKENFLVQGTDFIRSGQVNQWKESLTPELIAEFDRVTKEKFGPLNITF